jgi:kinesin family protein 5
MRAKSIKNSARVNAELSSTELKSLLKGVRRELDGLKVIVGGLVSELGVWRNGGKVEKKDWVDVDKLAASAAVASASPPRTGSVTPSRGLTPVEGLAYESGSRPLTPGMVEKDEREEFLRRENELEDQVAKTVRPTPTSHELH